MSIEMLQCWLPLATIVAAAAAVYLQWMSKRRRIRQLAALLPGPPGWPLLGNALLFMAKPEDLLGKITKCFKDYGEYVKFWLGPSELLVCVENPADIRLLLTSNKLDLKGPMYEFMKVFIGPGVLSEGGPVWRSHRKIANLSFNKNTIQSYAPVFNDSAADLVKDLCCKDPSETFNVYHNVVRCTTSSVCQTIIGLSKEESKHIKCLDAVVEMTHAINNFIFTNMIRWWLHIPPVYWLLGRKATERYYIKLVDEMTSDIITKKRRSLKERIRRDEEIGVIDRFILSGELTDQELKWETITFFTASQEASAKIASAVLLILAYLPEWQDKIYEEIKEALGADSDFVSDEEVRRLQYLDMVYKEALRCFPIGAFIQRTVEDEIAINGGKIILPVGASVVIPIHAVHRNPRYWQEPDLVQPERFLPENKRGRDPNVFIPFSLGAMDCIGRFYAESVIKIFVVQVVRRLRLEADGRMEDLPLDIAIAVQPANGYNLRVRQRSME